MAHTETDRKAFNDTRLANEHNEKVTAWLARNPEIGALNGGKYYKIVASKTVSVAELQED